MMTVRAIQAPSHDPAQQGTISPGSNNSNDNKPTTNESEHSLLNGNSRAVLAFLVHNSGLCFRRCGRLNRFHRPFAVQPDDGLLHCRSRLQNRPLKWRAKALTLDGE